MPRKARETTDGRVRIGLRFGFGGRLVDRAAAGRLVEVVRAAVEDRVVLGVDPVAGDLFAPVEAFAPDPDLVVARAAVEVFAFDGREAAEV
jgi:hypothetical protein